MIKFGTDGWRAIISDEFTFANVEKVAKAIALYLIEHKYNKRSLIIGYDPRFLADKFAEDVAGIMEGAGIDVFLTERDAPTPVVAWAVKDKKAAGAVMLTASHNPPEYCGIKFIPDYAGPAFESITAEIQQNSNREVDLPRPKKKGRIERFDPRERYLKYIESFVDPAIIQQAKLKVVVDPMYGCGRGYLDKLLQRLGCQTEEIHNYRDVLFGGRNPEPDEENLEELRTKVVETGADIGLALDGDADRFGVIDRGGKFYGANQTVPTVFDYLISDKGYTGSVVRSVGTSHMVDRIAALHGMKVYETPVGFKHIAKLMMEQNIVLGGEESGGLSIKGHIPEKDGILADLLIVEMLARRKASFSQIWRNQVAKLGPFLDQKINLRLEEKKKKALMTKLAQSPPATIAGLKIIKSNTLDGVKLILSDGSWVLCRPSGTEPLVRIYVESDKLQKLEAIVEAVRNLI